MSQVSSLFGPVSGWLLLDRSSTYHKLRSPHPLKPLITWFVIIVTLVSLCLLAPWQQTVVGSGKVTVFSPTARPQTIEAQMSGRLKQWYVTEGQVVHQGQLLVELADTDPKFMDPRQDQNMAEQQLALEQRKRAIEIRLGALESQGNAVSQSRTAALAGASQKVRQSQFKITVAQQSVEAARQAQAVADANFQRLNTLYQEGLRSRRDYELARLDKARADTGLQQAFSQLQVAQSDVPVSQSDQGKLSGDTSASLATVSATLASAQESLASVNSDLAKLWVDRANLKQRILLRKIKAPANGRIVRLLHLGGGETIPEGDVLATLVPETQDQAIELYVSDWDIPLVSEKRQVRLQFAGWPAIQFSGWPSIATGTFAGTVALVDAVDDGKGRYRILVVPDAEAIRSGKDQPWPDASHLRPGTGATGWILLDRVTLGYELWRQFNAFPIALQKNPEDAATKDDTKTKKAPKRKSK